MCVNDVATSGFFWSHFISVKCLSLQGIASFEMPYYAFRAVGAAHFYSKLFWTGSLQFEIASALSCTYDDRSWLHCDSNLLYFALGKCFGACFALASRLDASPKNSAFMREDESYASFIKSHQLTLTHQRRGSLRDSLRDTPYAITTAHSEAPSALRV